MRNFSACGEGKDSEPRSVDWFSFIRDTKGNAAKIINSVDEHIRDCLSGLVD
jgi:hypothetical protein